MGRGRVAQHMRTDVFNLRAHRHAFDLVPDAEAQAVAHQFSRALPVGAFQHRPKCRRYRDYRAPLLRYRLTRLLEIDGSKFEVNTVPSELEDRRATRRSFEG